MVWTRNSSTSALHRIASSCVYMSTRADCFVSVHIYLLRLLRYYRYYYQYYYLKRRAIQKYSAIRIIMIIFLMSGSKNRKFATSICARSTFMSHQLVSCRAIAIDKFFLTKSVSIDYAATHMLYSYRSRLSDFRLEYIQTRLWLE